MAGLALVALLVAAVLSAWWILTDQADFQSLLGRPEAEAESRESGRTPPDPARGRSGAAPASPAIS